MHPLLYETIKIEYKTFNHWSLGWAGLGWVELAGRARLASVRGSNNDALAALECRRQLDTVLPVGRDDDLQRCLPAISIRRRHRRRRRRRRNVLSWRRLSAGGGKPREVSEFG